MDWNTILKWAQQPGAGPESADWTKEEATASTRSRRRWLPRDPPPPL